MKQLVKNAFSIALLISLMGGVGFALNPAHAADPSPAKEDNEKMAADDEPDIGADLGDKTTHKSKKSHKKDHGDKDGLDDKLSDSDNPKPEETVVGNMELQSDSRIKLLLYDETDVYTITTRYGYQTNVVFGPQEEIELISVGDRSLWQIIPNGHRLFIRPMEEDVITNMTVLTNKHSYQFDLKSVPAGKGGNIYVAQFVYGQAKKTNVLEALTPPPAAVQGTVPSPTSSPFGVGPSVPGMQGPVALTAPNQGLPPQGMPPQGMSMAAPMQSPAPMPMAAATPQAAVPMGTGFPNYSYTYAGPDELAPLQVYDDGHSTYLKYSNLAGLSPTAFVVDPAGKETPIGYTFKGEYIVIDAVVGELALRSNGNVIHVFNETLNPG